MESFKTKHMPKETQYIQRENGEMVPAQFPVIVSASRSTDIPGFYADWFLHRLRVGYSAWTNPFNGVQSYVSYRDTRLIVFWSKNPEALLVKGGLLDYLEEKGIHCYIQYTLNDYVAEKLEKGVPSVEKRIGTFKRLVERLGVGKVIWRFDPLILTDEITIQDLLAKAENIGSQLKGFTEKMVFSFADISAYRKVRSNLINNNIRYREFRDEDMLEFAAGIQQLNREWGYTLATCGEKIDIEQFGIVHNKCVDDDLMIRFFSDDARLMEFLGVEITGGDLFNQEKTVIKHRNNKDKGQRQFCGCIISKDIGEYNTCAHLCEYCYANSSKEIALRNLQSHKANKCAETIIGK
jgi:DNA repair photolyase